MAKRRRRKPASSTPRRTHTRRRRRSSSMSEPGRKTRRRRSGGRGRRRRGLSEIFSPATFKEAGITTLWGTGGGMAANGIDRLGAAEASPIIRGVIHIGSAMVVSGVFRQRELAAGMAGGYGYTLLDSLLGDTAMSEDWDDADYADDDAMSEDYPDALDEEGNPMFLAEDGNLYYLEEFDLAEDGTMYLAESGIARMYPDYVQNP